MVPPADQTLVVKIDRADAEGLRILVENHAEHLDLGTARRVIRHPFATAAVLERLLAVPALRAVYDVRSRIARHRQTPLALAMRLVVDLYWRDLLEISINLRLATPLRRAAERYLIERMPRLATGERVALARRAGPRVLARLRQDTDERVIAASLSNPRMTEEIVLPMATNTTTPPRIIQQLATSDRWRNRYPVRQAMALNPQTPLVIQQTLIPTLRRGDLERVMRTPALSSVVHRWAHEALAERKGGTGRPRRV
jgi:hypothetical protein